MTDTAEYYRIEALKKQLAEGHTLPPQAPPAPSQYEVDLCLREGHAAHEGVCRNEGCYCTGHEPAATPAVPRSAEPEAEPVKSFHNTPDYINGQRSIFRFTARCLQEIPQQNSEGWNRYDTDTEHVLHVWAAGKSYDIRAPRVEFLPFVELRYGVLWDIKDEPAATPAVPRSSRLELAEQKLAEQGIIWEEGKGYVFNGKD
jgi:hypothetical protein